MPTATEPKKRRVVLIDDDPSFGRIMKHYAASFKIDLDHFESLEDLGFLGLLGNYDVAIVDYDLGSMTGPEIGTYLSTFFGQMPMLMISGTVRTPSQEEIKNGQVRPFMHKKQGHNVILEKALDMAPANAPLSH
jgi:FixJ family two-component response regulator